jgi:hypothetical protein
MTIFVNFLSSFLIREYWLVSVTGDVCAVRGTLVSPHYWGRCHGGIAHQKGALYWYHRRASRLAGGLAGGEPYQFLSNKRERKYKSPCIYWPASPAESVVYSASAISTSSTILAQNCIEAWWHTQDLLSDLHVDEDYKNCYNILRTQNFLV